MLTVSRRDFRREIPVDPSGTIEGDPARGIRVYVELQIPHPEMPGSAILQRIASPGLWGIEDSEDATQDVCDLAVPYWAEAWAEEERILEHMLTVLGVKVGD